MQDRIARWLLLLGALGFAVLGQYYFARKPGYFWDGVVFYFVAAALFLLLVRRPGDGLDASGNRPFRWSAALVARLVLVLFSLWLGLLAVIQSGRLDETLAGGGSAWPAFWTWISAMVLYLVAVARLPGRAAARTADRIGVIEEPQPEDRSLLLGNSSVFGRARGWLAAHGWEFGMLLLVLLGSVRAARLAPRCHSMDARWR